MLHAAIALILFASPLAAQSAAHPATRQDAGADMLLSPSEVKVQTHKAQAGDKDAAERLYVHYDAAHAPKQALKWRLTAAKLGDCAAAETVLDDKTVTPEARQLAKAQFTQWACKLGASTKSPPVPVMY
ncbi:MAG TPA: hypothetical protein VG407_01530 [Caulobacteraceae bacterium]|jgi:hypothetical protein|nr:hypothetical protein [Caulobacteraceae bacterium]